MYELFEDAASFSLFQTPVYMYGLFVFLGGLCSLFLFHMCTKKSGLKEGTSVLSYAFILPLGLVFARIVYTLLDTNFLPLFSLKAFFMFQGGGYSMYGMMLGAFLALYIVSKIQKTSYVKLLANFMPALFLFIFFERMGEQFTALGISRPLVYDTLKNTFLAQSSSYDSYLKTWLLESVCALVLSHVSLIMLLKHKDSDSTLFQKSALLYLSFQVLFESLRYDQHMRYGFIGFQHVISMVLFSVLVILIAVKSKKTHKKLALISLVYMPLSALVLIFIEFKIDRSNINKFLLYALYTLLLALPVLSSFTLLKEENIK